MHAHTRREPFGSIEVNSWTQKLTQKQEAWLDGVCKMQGGTSTRGLYTYKWSQSEQWH